ncbi:hypothetical protein OQI_33835 [Streptomyces pharetrae CZA14]|uniref:Secreted protein n=1 Tax=Streptomyces pharetrae CZA14 TaxID=1144883 RepID=A0ABX3Y9T9_9ACTN|nr:hypothetical protein OQI_33835 [Streptomyces pharetrae CZA14]
MVMGLLLVFAVLVALWWVVGAVADALIGRGIHLPDRWVVHVLPDRFPTYVRQDLARARQARATHRHPSTPED